MEEGKEIVEEKKPYLEINQILTTPAVAVRKALTNDAVLRGMARNFKGIEALKKFRSLNQKCFQVGTKALLDSEKGCAHLKGELQLNALLEDEQLNCLLYHGSTARRVSLDLGAMTKGSVGNTRRIIFEGLKRMDVLILRFTPPKFEKWLDDPTLLFQENDSLPNLRSVHLPLPSHIEDDDYGFHYERFRSVLMPEFIEKLISAAGNLEEIHNVDADALVVINELKRVELVKSLSDFLIDEEDLEDDWNWDGEQDRIVAFANSNPKLLKLSVHVVNIRNPNVKAIVESSKDTLTKIKIRCHRFVRPSKERIEDFPVLPEISSADFFTVTKLHECIGAHQFALSFPNLSKVIVNIYGWRYFQRFPESVRGVVFPTVQSLIMDFDPGATICASMVRLMSLFPSTKSVAINWHKFAKTWTIKAKVWNCLPKHVRRIHLYNFKLDKYENYGLDQLLTGVPKPMCKDLQKLKKDAIDFDRLRTKPSISTLEDLKSLKLYTVGDFKLEDVRTRNYLSQLSLWGAIDHMPGFNLEFVLPQDLIRDGNLNEVKLLLQPVAEVSSVSFYQRKEK